MSCWRVLELSDELPVDIPQLLIKPQFSSNAYTIFLTDLSNIWSEELDVSSIVRRASEVESPIEVSQRDTAQLAILFENIQKSLNHSTDSSCSVSCTDSGGLTLYTTISLPEPLDLLTWKFHLRKRPPTALKDELILPLLVSSHIQHERISSLLSIISEKDRALTRLVDQYESSNLDLAAAFPSIGNAKSGRRVARREQAARQIPGLQIFDENVWRKDTVGIVDTSVSSLGLFQEALSECTLKVPTKLKSDGGDSKWWPALKSSKNATKRPPNTTAKVQPNKTSITAQGTASDSATEEEETEDEFETHENFKSRDLVKKPEPSGVHASVLKSVHKDVGANRSTFNENVGDNKDDDEKEDDDLDALPRDQSQEAFPKTESPTPEPSPPEVALAPAPTKSPPKKLKAKGFKIGGKFRKAETLLPVSQEETPMATEGNGGIPARPKVDESVSGPKKMKKGFKIGGKQKAQTAVPTEEMAAPGAASRVTQSPPAEHSASMTAGRERQTKEAEEAVVEMEEEKVERKRRELKRKNEELAKKQALSKKKKRF